MKEAVAAFTEKLRDIKDVIQFHSDITVEVRDKHGNLKGRSEQHNLRTNVGADFWDQQLFKVGLAATTANYIALTTDATAASVTDTTLASEETTNGLQRAQAADAHTAAAASSVLSNTFIYSGSSTKAIAKVGLFNAASVGTLVLETLLTQPAIVNQPGDKLTVNWQVNY